MKKHLLAIFALIFSINANAQLFLGGGVSATHNGGTETTIGSTSVDLAKANVIKFDVQGGYYLSSNLALGLNLSIESAKTKQSNTTGFDHRGMTYISPFARYDLISNDKIAFGVMGTFVLGFGKENGQESDGTTYTNYKASQFGFKFQPVIDYKFNSNWSVYTTFGDLHFLSTKKKGVNNNSADVKIYDPVKNEDFEVSADEVKQTELKFDLSLLSLQFGVRYTF